MRHTGGTVHGIGNCQTCGWHTESYKNAHAIAAQHARKHKHVVSVEVAYNYTYFGGE